MKTKMVSYTLKTLPPLLKAQGKGYQSRINAILRREMLAAHRLSSAK